MTPSFDAIVGGPFACECGRTHHVPIEKIDVGPVALESLREFLCRQRDRKVLVVDDEQTGPALGDRVRELLAADCSDAGSVGHLRLQTGGHLVADEQAVDRARRAFAEAGAGVAVSVGSGTLTDVVRYASFLAGIPFVSVPTAPSVDGYASTVAALQFDGLKVTKEAHAPVGIFALPEVLAGAPWELIQAGFGDLLGKMTSLMDWKLAAHLYGEPWCEMAYGLVAAPLAYAIDHPEALLLRREDAIRELFMGLLSSGVAMAMMGHSRPASGCEHHLSHYWDYQAYRGRRAHHSHGLQVGYATHFTMRLYAALETLGRLAPPTPPQSDGDWEKDMRARWAQGAEGVLREQTAKARYLAAHADRATWSDAEAASLPPVLQPEYGRLRAAAGALKSIGIPDAAGYLEVDRSLLREALLHAREVRARVTILDLYAGQGRLPELVDRVLPA